MTRFDPSKNINLSPSIQAATREWQRAVALIAKWQGMTPKMKQCFKNDAYFTRFGAVLKKKD